MFNKGRRAWAIEQGFTLKDSRKKTSDVKDTKGNEFKNFCLKR
jgi:hypothetical protein